MLVALIIACEIGFWVLLGAGLVARYPLRRPRLGGALLVMAPLVDLVLLTASVIDLRTGGHAGTPHVLAAVYIGVSVGFGHRMIRWADSRFAHRYANGPAPAPKPSGGRARTAYELSALRAHLTAYVVGLALMGGAYLLVGDPDRTQTLVSAAGLWTIIVVVDTVWTLSYVVFPKRVSD